MTRIVELTNRRRATLGAAGTIRLAGEGIERRHAEITVYDSAGESITAIRPLEGSVSVERRGTSWAVTAHWPLADGDIVIVGPHRLTYRDLGSPYRALNPSQTAEVISWLL